MTDTPPDDLTPLGPPVEHAAAGQVRPVVGSNPYFPTAMAGPAAVPWREFDRWSLASFLLALTWVAAPIAVIAGIRGMRRTNDEALTGRWAAVAGIVIGALGLLAVVPAVAGVSWFRDSVKSVGRVEAGECADIDDGDGVSFQIQDCTELHEAEVMAAGDLDSELYPHYLKADTASEFCFEVLDQAGKAAAVTGQYVVTVVVGAADPDRPDVGDAYACYFERADGRRLNKPIDAGEQANV